ncbi:MAG: hypothetical protein SCARUB_02824 [Candidatus Scalindua rubra]|uniref:Uncharacterized protein n=1 Tax=Candidatus Scalindua rubra TaxID=1872076 RepID=A0A1E3X8Y4_9BACT|nr:MAG: hypothetical protein SCARUB_02824 [Candidatus Scalindua rubra]
MKPEIRIRESDIHPHIKDRMAQRGIPISEIEEEE